MQPKFFPSFSVDVREWAFWLDSIALQPQTHSILTQVEEEVQFLNEAERKELCQEGYSVSKLTMDKIIEMTQKLWNTPGIKKDEKQQMLNGIRYIHLHRQAKYKKLFWLVRIFAKLRGVDVQLKAEAQLIDQLQTDLTIPSIAHSKVPVMFKQIIQHEKKIASQLNAIQSKLEKLVKEKKQRKGDEKEAWHENFFSVERQLYHLRQSLSSNLLLKFKPRLEELNKILDDENGEIPRLRHIAKTFGNQSIKPSLRETLIALLDNKITEREVERDQALFQCGRFEVEILYTKRLIKAKRTALSLSLITAIERTWQEMLENNQKETETKILEGHRIIFLPEDKEIYIKDCFLSKGTYKATFVATPFHSLKTSKDRGSVVILQPVQTVLTEIEEYEEQAEKNNPSMSSKIISQSSYNSDDSSSDFNSIIIHESAEIIDKSAQTSNKEQETTEKNLEIESFLTHLVTSKTPERITEPKSSYKRASTAYSESSEFNNAADDEAYKKEAENCLLYGKLPGIWPTYKVTTIDQHIAIIQPTAYYQLKTTTGQEMPVITLEDMGILLNEDLLAKKDQLAFLKMMRHSLTGVESLHKLDLMHRDLKPQNILCSKMGTAAVSDLGTLCANMVEKGTLKVPNIEKKLIAGTLNYIPPEAACYCNSIHWNKINTAVDIWAIGLILWEAFSGKSIDEHPVHLALGNVKWITSSDIVNLIGEILSNKKRRGDIYNSIYPEPKERTSLAHLIWSCTRPNPSQRPLIDEVIARYEVWSQYTEDKMNAEEIQSIRETFNDEVI